MGAVAAAVCDDGNDSNNVLCRSNLLKFKQKKMRKHATNIIMRGQKITYINKIMRLWNSFEDAFVQIYVFISKQWH